jgi:uncharacterized membrane protein YccC
MTPEKKNTAVYIAKVAVGVLACYLVSYAIPRIDYIWSLISVVLVLSPEGRDAHELALMRIKGNIVGCLVGVLFLFAEITNPVNIIAGAAVALFACHHLKILEAARSTLAALVITLMHMQATNPWEAGLTRVAAVVAGCIVALGVTFLFHSLFRLSYGDETESKTAKSAGG